MNRKYCTFPYCRCFTTPPKKIGTNQGSGQHGGKYRSNFFLLPPVALLRRRHQTKTFPAPPPPGSIFDPAQSSTGNGTRTEKKNEKTFSRTGLTGKTNKTGKLGRIYYHLLLLLHHRLDFHRFGHFSPQFFLFFSPRPTSRTHSLALETTAAEDG